MLYRIFDRGLIKRSSLLKAHVAESLLRCVPSLASQLPSSVRQISFAIRPFSALPSLILSASSKRSTNSSLLNVDDIWKTSSRTVIKFSLEDGKKVSVEEVLTRFYRLPYGAWIRRVEGHDKEKYRKSKKQLKYDEQHIFCSKSQCMILDRMVTERWKKRTYYIDDPFEPYHVRNKFDWVLPHNPNQAN